MSNLVQRTKPPTENDVWYYSENPFYISGVGMPNCTAYAWGRFYEATGMRPTLSLDNAEKWYLASDGYERGLDPKIGAIACWSKGSAFDSNDGAGHVAFVERVYIDGSILTSESGWADARFWWTKRRYQTQPNWGGGEYTFQGFIYPPVNFENTVMFSTPILLALWKMSRNGGL